jgi:hypothetical protein
VHYAPPLAALALIALASPAKADFPVSPLLDIYESYNDCFKVATDDGLKPEVLGTLGWARATLTKDGKPVPDGPIIYGNPKRKPAIFLSAERGSGSCMVVARLESEAAFEQFKSAWGGKLPPPNAKGEIIFFAEGRPVQLTKGGTSDKPALTIAVMTPMEKK